MKKKYLNMGIVIIGFLAAFFFPEPETNFIAYMGLWFFFVVLLLVVNMGSRK